VGWLQEESGDGSEGAPQSVSKSDASSNVEPAQDTADLNLINNLTSPLAAYAARHLIRIMQNGSWVVGLQVSEALN